MQVKGTAVQTIPLFIKDKFGEQGVQKWLKLLSDPVRTTFSSSVLATAWFPLKEGLIEPTTKLCELFYRGRTDGAVELGRFSAEHGLRGVYKLFVKFASPDLLVSKASTIMPTYYQPCSMEVVDKGPKSATVRITRFDTPHTMVEHRIKGWMERALEISGAKMPRANIRNSMTSGSAYTEFVVTWS